MNKKVLIISLLALFVFASFVGWFLLREQKLTGESPKSPVVGENPTKNSGNIEPSMNVDTSNWKTYRNEEYGFELKYPGEWEIEKGMNTFPGVALVARDGAVNGRALAEISIYAPTLRELRESSDWKANDQVVLNKMMIDFEEKQEEPCLGPNASCFLPCSGRFFTGERLYSIRYASLNGYLPFDTAKEVCSNMMSSFKVTEENTPPVDTSNWKTYRNEEYGFEVKYPEDIYEVEDGGYISLISFVARSKDLKEKFGDIQVLYGNGEGGSFDEKGITENNPYYHLVNLGGKKFYFSEEKSQCGSVVGLDDGHCVTSGSVFFFPAKKKSYNVAIARITPMKEKFPVIMQEEIFIQFLAGFKLL